MVAPGLWSRSSSSASSLVSVLPFFFLPLFFSSSSLISYSLNSLSHLCCSDVSFLLSCCFFLASNRPETLCFSLLALLDPLSSHVPPCSPFVVVVRYLFCRSFTPLPALCPIFLNSRVRLPRALCHRHCQLGPRPLPAIALLPGSGFPWQKPFLVLPASGFPG